MAKGKGGQPRKGRSRTTALVPGINDKSHAQVVKAGARYKWFKKGGAAKKAATVAAPKTKYYPADDVPVPRKSSRGKQHITKLRSSITPGTVLILLSGRFRGKRVVFLKQLASGTLLVTGPYALNGVPLRRVNQAYVIATSVKVDVSGVKVPDSIDDKYFTKAKEADKQDEDTYFSTTKKETTVSDARKKDQAAIDAQVTAAVKKVEMLEGYLKAKFSLKKGDKPHALKF